MERKGESKLGNLSLVISIISSIGLILRLVLSYESFGDESIFMMAVIFGLTTVFFGFLSFCSLVLGLAGIYQNTSDRKSAFIGTTISVALLSFYIIIAN